MTMDTLVLVIRLLLGLAGFMVVMLGSTLIATSVFTYKRTLEMVILLTLGIMLLSCGTIMVAFGIAGLTALPQLGGR